MRDIALGIGAAGMIGCLVFLVAILISLIKHKPSKPKVIALCVSFAAMVTGGVMAGPTPEEDATTEVVTERTLVTETEEIVSETTEPETAQSTTTEKRTTTEEVTESTSTEAETYVVDLDFVPDYSGKRMRAFCAERSTIIVSALISEPGKLRLREQRTLNIRRKVIGRQLLFPKVTGNNRLYGLTP